MKWPEVTTIALVFLYNAILFIGAGILVWHGTTAWVFVVPLLVAITRIKTGDKD